MKMSLLLGIAVVGSVLSNISLAEEKGPDKSFSPLLNDPAPKEAPKQDGEVVVMRKNCYTTDRDCAGMTTVGGFNYAVGCSIWWNNGAAGRRNFTLRAGEKIEVDVRFNDYGACIGAQYAPPQDYPRFALYVHN